MMFIDFLYAVFFALLLSAVFFWVFGWRRRWVDFGLFFVLLFLATWAGGIWLRPFGGMLYGRNWLPFFTVAVIIALLLAAVSIPERSTTTVELRQSRRKERARQTALASVSIFFYAVVLALIIAIVAGYL